MLSIVENVILKLESLTDQIQLTTMYVICTLKTTSHRPQV